MSDSYYANKLASLNQLATSDKKTNLLEAFDNKIAALREYSAIKAQQDAAGNAQAEGSWVGHLGLDPDADPISHTIVNSLARFGSGSTRLAGQAAVAAEDFLRNGLATDIPQSVRDARARQLNGEATEADLALLDAPYGFTEAPTYKHVTKEQFDRLHKDSGTNLSHIKKWEENQNELSATRTYHDVSSIVDKRGTQRATDQLAIDGAYASMDWQRAKKTAKEGDYFGAFNDALSAGGKMASSVGKVGADNPAEVLGAITENSPQLLAGALLGLPGTVAAVGSYAIDEYNDAIEDFRKQNNGAMPPEDWMRERGLGAFGLAVSEGVSDRLTLGMGKLLKAGGSVAEKAVDGMAEGLKKSLASAALKTAGSLPVRTALGGLLDASGEYGTEALQTNIENAMRGKDTSFEESHQAGAMGAWAGGPIAAVASLLEGNDTHAANVNQPDGAPSLGRTPEFDAAISSRDPGALLQTGKPLDQLEALKAVHHLMTNESGTDEEKAKWQATADTALANLKKEHSHATDLLDPAKRSEAVTALKEAKSVHDSIPATDVEDLALAKDLLQRSQKKVATFDAALQDLAGTTEKIQSLRNAVDEAQLLHAELEKTTSTSAPQAVNVKQALADANTDLTHADEATKSKASEAVKSLVLSMASESPISASEARSLASNKANGLSQQHRDYFLAFADAMEAVGRVKDISKVNNEVLYGDPKSRQVGILQYQERVGRLLADGKKAEAGKVVEAIRKFASGHKTKATALTTAFDQAQNSGKEFQVIKQDGAWKVEPLKLSPKDLAEKGGFKIHKGSEKLIGIVQAETHALVKAAKALQVAVSLDLSSKPAVAQTTQVQPNVSPKPVEAVSTPESQITSLEKERKKVAKSNERSMFTVLRNKLNDADLNDIYGSEWRKRFTFLKGKQARSLVDQVTDGLLNDYLPANLRFGTGLEHGLDQEQQAVEYIKEKLRNQDYLTEDTKNALAKVDLTIQQLESALTKEEVDALLEAKTAELQAQQVESGDAGSTQPTATEATSGSADSTPAAEGAEQSPSTPAGSEPVAPESKPNGILDVLANGASFLAGKIVQKLKGEGTIHQNPLVAVKDFLSSWLAGDVSPEQFLKGELDEKQSIALENFKQYAQAVAKALPGILRSSDEGKYARKNPAEFLMTRENGKLDLPENVKTAVAMATMTWLADAIRSSAYNGKKEINQILGKDEDAVLTGKMIELLSDAGVRRSVVANELGKKITQALGMSMTSKAGKSLLPRIESTLGGYALTFLVRNGLVTQKKISGAEFSKLTGNDSTDQYFIRASFDAKTKDWAPQVKQVAEPLIGTKGVLEKLFSVETGLRAPSLKPESFTQSKAKKSSMGVPNWLAVQLDKEAKNAYHLDTDAFHLLASMSEDTVVGLQGAFDGDTEVRHLANRKGLQAKKDGLLREWRNLIEFVSSDLATSEKGTQAPFYFMPSVWKNQRVGLANNLVNPQTSKIHRGLMFQESWKTEIDPTNPESLNAFKLRVLEKFGVKIEKDATEKVLSVWQDKVSAPEIVAAIAALNTWTQTKEMTPGIESAIAAGVAKAGEGMGSFNALMALAQMQQANGGKFTTTLTAEIDGVANGPMLSMLLLGAAQSIDALKAVLNMGGFFEQGSGLKNFNIFRGMPGVQDLYETAGSKLMDVLSKVPAHSSMNSLWYFLGTPHENGKVTSSGRKLVKTPITALVFGSSMSTATGNMVNDLIDGIYSSIEEVNAGTKDRSDVLKHINAFLPSNLEWDVNLSADEMLNRTFTGKELAAVEAAFNALLGKHVKAALDPLFGSLTARRDVINKTAAASFGLYESVKKALTTQFMEHLAETGQVQSNSNGSPTWDLTAEQETVLNRMLKGIEPVIHTAMSSIDDKLSSGILLAKQKTKQSSSDLYHSTVQFAGEGFDKSMGIYSQERVVSEPGTMVLPTQTHSFDSGVSHSAADTKSLNVHDARIVGVSGALTVAESMNHGVWSMALEYSPLNEVYESLSRSISGLVKLLETKSKDQKENEPSLMAQALAPSIKSYFLGLAKQLKIQSGKSDIATIQAVVTRLLSDAKYEAYQADSNRLGVLAVMEHIDQYAAEGGQYDVTEADRAAAAKKLAELEMGVPAAVLAQVDKLTSLLDLASNTKLENASAVVSKLIQEDAQGMADSLGVTHTQAIRLMQALSMDTATPETIKDSLTAVLDAVNSGMVLADALSDALHVAQAKALIEFVKGKMATGIQGRYGLLGQPRVAAVPGLLAFFEATPVTSGKALVAHINSYLKGMSENPVAQAYRQMLVMAARAMGDDVKVVYVTPETDPSLVKAMPDVTSRGWFDTEGKTLYVLSPDHSASGLDTELLIHELTHAALHDVVDSPKTPVQKELVNQLTALMEQAHTHAQEAGSVNSVFQTAFTNIHEFIAYGLTNRKFQAEVLGKMQVENKGKVRELISGLQSFLTKLAGLLFNRELDVSSEVVDGFTAMVANVTSLYADLAHQQDAVLEKSVKAGKSVLSMASATNTILEFSTHQVFDALAAPGVSVVFQEKLDKVLTMVVNTVHGPFGAIKTKIESTIGRTPLEAWTHALQSGQRPFASKALNSAVQFSQKEAFVTEQVEATVRQFLDDKSSASSMVYRELEQLYQQAKETLKGRIPADTYAYVFQNQSNTKGHTKSDYLSKFIALGLANEDFNKALEFETRKPQLMARGITFMERMEEAWKGVIDWIGARWTGTHIGQKADAKLERLVSQLIQIESRYKVQVPGINLVHDFMEHFSQSGDGFIKGAKEKLADAAESDFITKNKFSVVRLAGAVTAISARGRVDGVMEAISKIRNQHQNSADGTLAGLLSYVRGPGQWATGLLMGTKRIEQQRQSIISDVSKIVLDTFKDGGANLTKAAKAGVTYVFLRTGAHALLDKYSMSELHGLIDSPKALAAAIDEHVAMLDNFHYGDYYIKQAAGLGFYLATNKVGLHGQNTNSHAISRLFGTGKKVPDYAADVAPIIERLAALNAIKELGRDSFGREHLKEAAEVLRTESQRGDANGVEMALLTHKKLEQDARDRLFSGGNEGLMIQGWLPEVSNPHTSFQVVRDPAEAAALENQGYEFVHAVALDSVDPDRRPALMYILRGGGLGRRQSGVFSVTDIGTKGASKHNQYYNPDDADGVDNMISMSSIQAAVQPSIASQFNPDPGFDPRKAAEKNDFMLPVFNASGQIVDYRYVMGARNRDTMLERDNRFEHLLGVSAGTTYDKLTSSEQNARALEALREHYKQNFSHSSSDFIRVAHNSPDARMREIWNMLPDATKRDVRGIWKENGLWVPKNMVDMMFGYRKYSLAEAFEKQNPNFAEKFLVKGVTRILFDYARYGKNMDRMDALQYAKRGAVATRKAEAAWQEVVKEAKDFIVIKGVKVMTDNILSNTMMLMGKGVPMVQAAKDMFVAWRAAIEYDRDTHALRKLEMLVETGYGSRSMQEVKAKITELQDALARNPVAELVEAGLKPTIVEDVGMEDNPYSYKSQLTQWVEGKTKKINPGLLKAGRFVYMAHDTALYNLLNKTTQYSDFVARYALYKHQTERAKTRLSKADALFEAAETFVTYDIPMPKNIQYLDEMGITPFIKYFFSIQRVLLKTFKEKPLNTLMMSLTGSMFGGMPLPTDSWFLPRIGNNPFSAGALMLPHALTEAATVQASLALIK